MVPSRDAEEPPPPPPPPPRDFRDDDDEDSVSPRAEAAAARASAEAGALGFLPPTPTVTEGVPRSIDASISASSVRTWGRR